MTVLFGIVVGVWAATRLLGLRLPASASAAANIVLVATPLLLWLIFSLLAERRALLPRLRLVECLVLSALVANAIGVPLINEIFQLDRWLPLESVFGRILGYTFTFGITQELLKYLVVRLLTWEQIGTREDALAYTLAAALGYVMVLNVRFLLATDASLLMTATTVFGTLAASVSASIIVSYGLAEMRLARPSPFLMTITLALSALIQGAIVSLRAGIVNAGFSIEGSSPSFILGIVVSGALLLATTLLFAFFYRTAERRERESVKREM